MIDRAREAHAAYQSSLCIARRKRGRGQGARKRRAREARLKHRSGVRFYVYDFESYYFRPGLPLIPIENVSPSVLFPKPRRWK